MDSTFNAPSSISSEHRLNPCGPISLLISPPGGIADLIDKHNVLRLIAKKRLLIHVSFLILSHFSICGFSTGFGNSDPSFGTNMLLIPPCFLLFFIISPCRLCNDLDTSAFIIYLNADSYLIFLVSVARTSCSFKKSLHSCGWLLLTWFQLSFTLRHLYLRSSLVVINSSRLTVLGTSMLVSRLFNSALAFKHLL